MPKVILKKSIASKVSTPAAKSKQTEKVANKSKETEKAKLKAERETLIEAQVESISEAWQEITSAETEVESKKIQLAKTLRDWRDENEASEKEVRELLARAIAEAGGYDWEELSGKQALELHGSDASKLSVICRLVCPKEEHEKAYAKAFNAVVEGKKKYSLGKLTQLARNGTVPTEGGGKGSGRTAAARQAQSKKKETPFDTIEAFTNALAGILQGAEKSGFDDEEVGQAVDDHMAEWLARNEDAEEE